MAWTPWPGPVSAVGAYASAVACALREHLPDFDPSIDRARLEDAITANALDPQASFEYIVDDPRRANWRLKACSDDRHRVRLACYRINCRDADVEVERTVNEALQDIHP